MPKTPNPQPYTGPGRLQFEIGPNDFLKGMTSSDDLNDGGFSNQSVNINLLGSKGNVYPCALPTNLNPNSDTLNIIMSCDDPRISGRVTKLFVCTDQSFGNPTNFSTWDGSTLSTAQTDSTNYYSAGPNCDFIPFYDVSAGKVVFLATTNNNGHLGTDNVVYWDGTATAGATHFNATWWTGTVNKSSGGHPNGLTVGVPHPMIVFNKIVYIANGNLLAQYDGTNALDAVLTLSKEQTITALSIDPASGLMLVSVTTGANASSTLPTSSYIGLYDGFNPTQFRKIIRVEEQVNCFRLLGGDVITFYGTQMGKFTGNGVKYLRTLNVSLAARELPYKHHVTVINNTLYVIEGTNVLAYGEIIGGTEKIFYYPSTGSGFKLNMITSLGSGLLGYSYLNGSNVGFLYNVDLITKGTSSQVSANFYSNNYYMPRPVFVRAVDIQLDRALSSGSHFINLITDKNTTYNPTGGGFMSSTSSSGGTQRFSFTNVKTSIVQLFDQMSGVNAGFKRAIVYYDYAE